MRNLFGCQIMLVAVGAMLGNGADGVLSTIREKAGRFDEISRQIWESPELGYHEVRSSKLLEDALRVNGFTVRTGVAGIPTAFVASFGSGVPVIALMGEFDALPELSQKDVPARSPEVVGAPGHGCGHNLLGAGSALAAVAIKEEMQARALKGTIRYYGTPAEEGGGGKIYMLHAGLFQDVDAVLAWHPADANRVNLGSSLANDTGFFRFHGVAAHAAAAPERGRSALDGLMITLQSIEFLREHVPQETRIHYIITNGGRAPNVVPAFAEASLIARHPDAQTLAGIWQRIMNCAQAGALASGTTFEFVQGATYSNLLPNDTLSEVLGRAMKKAGGYEFTSSEKEFADTLRKTLSNPVQTPAPDQVSVSSSEPVSLSSTDAGDVSWVVPTAQINTATFVPGVTAHTWQAAACAGSTIGRKGMRVAAETLALAAVELLEHPDEVKAARAAFEKRRAGRKWPTAIPSDAKPPLDYSEQK